MFGVRRLFYGSVCESRWRGVANPFVVATKQGQREGNVLFAVKVETDPPRIRHVMVRRDFAAGNEFIAHRTWKKQVGNLTSMEVANFPLADAEFATAETTLSGGHARPAQQFSFDCFADFNL